MAVCLPSATLTLFSTSTSSTVITTSTVVAQTQPDGTVSTLTVPLIVTSIVTVVNPTSTLYASCSDNTPISTIPSSLTSSSSATPQPTLTIVIVTTTPPPTVITTQQSSTLGNGVVTVFTITSTSTLPPTVIAYQTSVATSQQSPTSKSSSNIAPIAGGAAGGFVFVVGVVFAIWFILKKCRKVEVEREEEEVVFPYPVTRDRDQTRRLDLTRESRPYEYGLVGRSTPQTPGSSPGLFNNSRASDGRRDSASALIGPSSGGLPHMAFTSANVASMQGTQSRGGDVGRQTSHGSAHQLPPGAAPPGSAPPGAAPPHDYYSPSVTGSGSVSGSSATGPGGPTSRRTLQVINPPLSPMQMRSSVDMSSSGSAPMVGPEPERPSMWPEKMPSQDFASSSGAILVHSDGGLIEGSGHRPSFSVSGSGEVPERRPPTQPIPTNEEHTDAPPAYAE